MSKKNTGIKLDEAIERYTSNAEYERTHGNLQGFLEFRQLAEWLKDYQRLLKAINDAKAEIKDLHNSHMINFVDADGAVDTCLEIIDRHMGKEGAE